MSIAQVRLGLAGAKCRVSRRCLHRARALVKRWLWKRWKAEERFPFSHNLGYYYGHESVNVAQLWGLKPRIFGVAIIGTDKSVPFQSFARM
jgi:hypothetical protein